MYDIVIIGAGVVLVEIYQLTLQMLLKGVQEQEWDFAKGVSVKVE